MFTIAINGIETEGEINFGTALDYELEFGKDMVADVNGSVQKGDVAFVTFDEDDKLVGINFEAVPWTTLLKVLWCAVKTADPKTKPFKKWAAESKGLDMFDVRMKLTEAMEDCFFRNAPVEQGADEQ